MVYIQFWIWHLRESISDSIPNFVRKGFQIIAYLLSDYLISNSYFTAKSFKWYGLKNKLKIISNGVNDSKIMGANYLSDVRIKYNIPIDIYCIGTFSRIFPRKGLSLLIDAFNYLIKDGCEAVLAIAGEVDKSNESYYNELKRKINAYDIKPNVIFTGFLTDIYPVMNSVDLVVSTPILPESFGRTIIEAMVCRKPVIASNIGAHPELIKNGVNGLLVGIDNPKELAKKMKFLIMNKDISKAISIKGRFDYENHYTFEKCFRQIETVYRSI